MKNHKWLLVLAVPAALSLTGCVVAVGGDSDKMHWKNDKQEVDYRNRQKISELVTNMSITNVQDRMGIADFNESYDRDGQKIQVLFYKTHVVKKDGITKKDECTPLVFIGGYLVSWGDKAYELL